MELSIVIPLFNEEENIPPLVEEIIFSLQSFTKDYEIVLVNDGSNDQTEDVLQDIYSQYPLIIKAITHNKNRGQGLAIRTGIENSLGNYIAILDGDGQFDPKDILVLYGKIIESEYDLVCGKRKIRKDSKLFNIIPSKIGNSLISRILKYDLSDIGCALKIGHRDQMLQVSPFKNYHRYLSIFLIKNGMNFCEIDITHRKRLAGRTKYGWYKFIKVIWEVLWIKFYR